MKKSSLALYAIIILLLHLTCKKEETAPLAKADAGNDTIVINQTTLKLSANLPNRGEGSWILFNGSGGKIADFHNPSTTFTGEYCTEYYLIWTIRDEKESSSEKIKIQFVRSLVSYAGKDTTVTSGSIPLKAQAPNAPVKGKWSIIEGSNCSLNNDTISNTTLNVQNCGTYVLRWTVSDQCASASDDVIINVISQEPTTASAGADQNPAEGVTQVTLAANTPLKGTGRWSIVSGPEGTFTDPANPTTTFNGAPGGKFKLRWTIKTLCDSSYDDMQVNLSAPMDYDGNYYKIVTIGNQVWFAENLKTTHFMNGDEIAELPPNIYSSSLPDPKYQWEMGSFVGSFKCGKYYTWYVIEDNRKICPSGWHVSTDYDWQVLLGNLGGSNSSGGKLKEEGTEHWKAPNTGATNETGFYALPSGYSTNVHEVVSFGVSALFWTTEIRDNVTSVVYELLNDSTKVEKTYRYKVCGLPVRCVKD